MFAYPPYRTPSLAENQHRTMRMHRFSFVRTAVPWRKPSTNKCGCATWLRAQSCSSANKRRPRVLCWTTRCDDVVIEEQLQSHSVNLLQYESRTVSCTDDTSRRTGPAATTNFHAQPTPARLPSHVQHPPSTASLQPTHQTYVHDPHAAT